MDKTKGWAEIAGKAREAASGLKAWHDRLPRPAKAALGVAAVVLGLAALSDSPFTPEAATPGPGFGTAPSPRAFAPQRVPNVALQTETARSLLTQQNQNTIDMSRAIPGYRP